MVLANGQYMFTCDSSLGEYNLTVPPDNNGEITLFGFCDGLASFKRVLKPEEAEYYDIEMVSASPDSKKMTVTYEMTPLANGWIKISGKILSDETPPSTGAIQPLCAMVLANGQHMFSCGEKFPLGEYELTVPPDANGEITLFGFCDGLQPYKKILKPGSDIDKDSYTENEGDCNDTDSDIHPGATEICGDGIDQDWTEKIQTVLFPLRLLQKLLTFRLI